MRLFTNMCPAVGRAVMTATILSGLIAAVPAAAQTSDRQVSASEAMTSARETPTVLAIRRASPAVVNIHGQKTIRTTAAGMAGARGADSFRQVNGMGTGVVIDPRGYVITNYHVVEDVADIRVTLHNGETTTADLIATKKRSDLALIKVRTNQELPTIPRGTSSDLMVGERVIAIGNAYGYVHTSTQGIISALHRDVPVNEVQEYVDLIQISAGINPGNSGGPLLNINGDMIGVNVAVRVGAQQIAFAIPIDQVVKTVTEMIDQHNEQRLTTGMRLDSRHHRGDGIKVVHVSASSSAARQGIKAGDLVVRVGSQPVDNRLDFALAMLSIRPGQALDLGVDRDGAAYDVSMKVTTRQQALAAEANQPWSVVGIQARPVSGASIRRLNSQMKTDYPGGLTITAVRSGSPAAEQGIQAGDILLGIHGWQTSSLSDLNGILSHPDVQTGPRAKFYIVRREQTLFGHLQLAAQAQTSSRR